MPLVLTINNFVNLLCMTFIKLKVEVTICICFYFCLFNHIMIIFYCNVGDSLQMTLFLTVRYEVIIVCIE